MTGDGLLQRLAVCAARAGGVDGLAAQSGIPRRTLDTYLTGAAELKMARAIAIAEAAGVRMGWLATGEEPMVGSQIMTYPESHVATRLDTGGDATRLEAQHRGASGDVVWVPLYDGVEVSAGNGSLVWDETPGSALAFQRQWIQSLRTAPGALALMRVRGESMEPVLHAGDVVMIDRSQRQVQRDGMYVLRLDGAVLLKWLQVLPEGAVRVASENRERFPPFELTAAQASATGFEVIGRVRWWAHRAS